MRIDTEHEVPANRRGRPRDLDLGKKILRAAQELLADLGYDRLTLEGVAERAGVGRPALYRRWSDKSSLVLDAVAALRWEAPTPNTGSLREDLVALAAYWNRADTTRDAIIRGLLPAMGRDPELRAAVETEIGRPRATAFKEIIERASRRGQCRAGLDIDLLSAVFPAMAFHRISVLGGRIDQTFVAQIVDGILVPLITEPAG